MQEYFRFLNDYYDKTVDTIGDDLEHFTIAKEKHPNSDYYHVHWYLKYTKRATVYPTTYDNKLGKHGNLKVSKRGNVKANQYGIVKYVTKDGQFRDWPADWDSQSFIKEYDSEGDHQRETKTDIVAQRILDGKYKNPTDVARDGFAGTAQIEDDKEHERTKGFFYSYLMILFFFCVIDLVINNEIRYSVDGIDFDT